MYCADTSPLSAQQSLESAAEGQPGIAVEALPAAGRASAASPKASAAQRRRSGSPLASTPAPLLQPLLADAAAAEAAAAAGRQLQRGASATALLDAESAPVHGDSWNQVGHNMFRLTSVNALLISVNCLYIGLLCIASWSSRGFGMLLARELGEGMLQIEQIPSGSHSSLLALLRFSTVPQQLSVAAPVAPAARQFICPRVLC